MVKRKASATAAVDSSAARLAAKRALAEMEGLAPGADSDEESEDDEEGKDFFASAAREEDSDEDLDDDSDEDDDEEEGYGDMSSFPSEASEFFGERIRCNLVTTRAGCSATCDGDVLRELARFVRVFYIMSKSGRGDENC